MGFRAACTSAPASSLSTFFIIFILLQVRERELHRPKFSSIEILYTSDQLSDSSSLSG